MADVVWPGSHFGREAKNRRIAELEAQYRWLETRHRLQAKVLTNVTAERDRLDTELSKARRIERFLRDTISYLRLQAHAYKTQEGDLIAEANRLREALKEAASCRECPEHAAEAQAALDKADPK